MRAAEALRAAVDGSVVGRALAAGWVAAGPVGHVPVRRPAVLGAEHGVARGFGVGVAEHCSSPAASIEMAQVAPPGPVGGGKMVEWL